MYRKRINNLSRNFLCITLSILSIYWFIDGMVYRVFFSQKVFVGLVLSITFAQTYIVLIKGEKFPIQYWIITCSTFIIGVQGLILTAIKGGTNWSWFLADLGTWIFIPAFLFLCKNTNNSQFIRILKYFIYILFAFSIIVLFLGERNNSRSEGPAIFLIAAMPFLQWQSESLKEEIAIYAMHFCIGYMCILSGSRTHVIIWILITLILICFLKKNKLFYVVALLSLVALISLSLNLSVDNKERLRSQVRLPKNAMFYEEQSLNSRWLETYDVIQNLLVYESKWVWVVGLGHGSAYTPNKSNIVRNMGRDGTVHNIHISPVLMLFRYGAIGLIWYVFIGMYFLSSCLKRIKKRNENDRLIFFLCIVVLTYFASSFVRNEFANPLFLFSIGAAFSRKIAPQY